MAITFPTGIDSLTNPIATNTQDSPSHAGQHSDANDAIEALEAKVGVDNSTVGDSLDFKIQKKPTDLLISTASKGGVLRNIDGAVGDVALVSSNGWVEDEKFSFYVTRSGATSVEFDSAVTRTGRLTLKSSATDTAGNITASIAESTTSKYLINIKPSTKYSLKCYVKTNNVGANGAYLDIREYNDAGTVIVSSTATNKLSGTNDWTLLTTTLTTNASSTKIVIRLHNNVVGTVSDAWFDVNSMTLEEVVTDTTFTGKVAEKIRPVLQAVTSTDNIDQSLDPTGAYTNTYALTTAVNEGATHLQTFQPGKKYITQIGVWCVAKGTGDWTLVVHDASNVVLASKTTDNASLTEGAFNYFDVPNIWASGNLHFHLYSSVADGTCKADTSNDLETASYIQNYAKKTENFTIISNGVKTDLKADKDGLLSNAIIDLDNGKYRWVMLSKNVITISNLYSYLNRDGTRLITTNGLPISTVAAIDNDVIKYNFILPAKSVTINLTSYISATRSWKIQYSFDNITYIDLKTFTDSDTSGNFVIPLQSGNILYTRFVGVSSTCYLDTFSIEADLDTSSIPQGLFYPIRVNQFAETWKATGTVLSYVYRQAKYTNEYGVVMPAIELNSGATGAGTALGYLPLKLDNSQETTPAITILASSGVASDTVLDADGEYVALSSGATEGSVNYQVTITKNTLYLSSNADSVDSTQDPSHQANFIVGVRNQGLTDRVKDVGNEIADIKQGVLAMVNSSPKVGYDAGTTDAYEITIPNFTGYYAGMSVLFKANTVNTGACTLNINGMGAKAIVKGITTALADADILALMWCQVVYDGTAFVLLNPRVL